MKTVSLAIVLFVLLSSQTFAISPANVDLISEAQAYGETHAQVVWTDFAAQWGAFEEQAGRLDDSAEYAYLYTPFLLIASDAKEKTLIKQNLTKVDTEKLLADYNGFLVFSVKLFGSTKDFAQGCNAQIKQGKTIISSYQNTIPPEAADTIWKPKEPLYVTQCYFYFLEKDIDITKPISLEILKSDKLGSSFYFDLPRIK